MRALVFWFAEKTKKPRNLTLHWQDWVFWFSSFPGLEKNQKTANLTLGMLCGFLVFAIGKKTEKPQTARNSNEGAVCGFLVFGEGKKTENRKPWNPHGLRFFDFFRVEKNPKTANHALRSNSRFFKILKNIKKHFFMLHNIALNQYSPKYWKIVKNVSKAIFSNYSNILL